MLHTEIERANLSKSEQSSLRNLLIQVAESDGGQNILEQRFIDLIVPENEEKPVSIQSLWNHSEIVLTACVSLAVLNGRYPVEKARIVSGIAQKLGYSSKKLRELEGQVLRMIHMRGKQVPQDFQLSLPKTKNDRLPKAIQESPFSEALFQLWQSDAELIQHTEPSIDIEEHYEEDSTKN